jgi:succinate dehydrogenase / fumarate reductase cytochrome b subunit
LLVNASVLNGAATFQKAVYQIHSLGAVLPLVEWTFIFLPILFHAVLGVVIVWSGAMNTTAYPYLNNVRYTLQRVTGLIAFAFIIWHVFHMHGWLHWKAWLDAVAEPLSGAQFRPYNAASSLGAAMSGWVVPTLYAIGVISCVLHLANGIWTMGITWGLWTTPAAYRRADWACLVLGIGVAAVGAGALRGASSVPLGEALEVEEKMFHAKDAAGEIKEQEAEHKRWRGEELEELRRKAAAPLVADAETSSATAASLADASAAGDGDGRRD